MSGIAHEIVILNKLEECLVEFVDIVMGLFNAPLRHGVAPDIGKIL